MDYKNTLRKYLLPAVCAVTALSASVAQAASTEMPAPANSKQVFFVGNNWDGTVTVIRPSGDFGKIGVVNMIPDRKQRLLEIHLNPIKLIAYTYIQQTAGEGNDQLVDDMYSTPDGQSIVASRPSFADVVSINIKTGKINWRTPVEGFRADHMAVSPDGQRVAVSASSGNVVHVLDIHTGKELGRFATGDKPHENIYFANGSKILNSAIGNVETSMDAQWQDFTKGKRYITIADANTYKVLKKIDFRPALDAFGRKDLSNSVRPMVFSKDESKLYAQVSFFNGLVEYDLNQDKITRIAQLPGSSTIPKDRTKWVNDSRHHGLSISADGEKLCVAGTMDDYATIVDRRTLQATKLIPAGKPYWATRSPDGKSCVISESETDVVTVIDFATGEKVRSVPVGNHPQRVRLGYAPSDWSTP
ncbi:YncE family protein [Acinetobacter indicus]|uniref:YncE family protein n=1 Tax=Acinetobacter TaxID=469 RepID=UPI0015D23115|nr:MULTISPECIES: YncE family protein [Acinetobacter]MDM1261827.1 YncE family protein [Acinetobacter indicus]MDM1274455.1 YncE family protein [Acinetobacter indicus]MDM1300898.1 YncE family protein [Acinetobacter indicus]QSQ96692.1 YncE family protein [Acinetobacter indicus]UNW08831.1 YncE family protein [Acinetobacter indicus]